MYSILCRWFWYPQPLPWWYILNKYLRREFSLNCFKYWPVNGLTMKWNVNICTLPFTFTCKIYTFLKKTLHVAIHNRSHIFKTYTFKMRLLIFSQCERTIFKYMFLFSEETLLLIFCGWNCLKTVILLKTLCFGKHTQKHFSLPV